MCVGEFVEEYRHLRIIHLTLHSSRGLDIFVPDLKLLVPDFNLVVPDFKLVVPDFKSQVFHV